MLDQKEILEIFRETKAIREGHFRMASGRHSQKLIQTSLVIQYPGFNERLCEDLARKFKGLEIDVVIAPAGGGILVAYEIAKTLNVRFIFAERDHGKMILRRGYHIEEDENVLVVGDAITTGSSIREIMDLVHEKGAFTAAVGVLVDRSAGKVHFGVKKEALLTVEIESWEQEECPLCQNDVPLTKIK